MSNYTLYIGSFLNSDKAPLYRCEFDALSGEISLSEVYRDFRPSWLCSSERGQIFFAREAESIGDARGGGIGCFSDDMQHPTLSVIGASGPCHVCERENHLFLSCYTEGVVAALKWLGNSFSDDVTIIRHEGKSINPKRQSQAHPHFSLFTPDGDFLAVCDLGLDKIFFYPYDKESGIGGEGIAHRAPEGTGPRHAVFSQDGRYLFVVTEMGGSILSYEYDGKGGIRLLCESAVMPEGTIDGEPQCAAIRLSPDASELIVTERRSASIVFFTVNKDGTLSRGGIVPTAPCPRDAVFSPDGKWLLTACQEADLVRVYSYAEGPSAPVCDRVKHQCDLILPPSSKPCALLFAQHTCDRAE